MNLKQRVSELEDAHRALAARNEALIQICKVMLPISLFQHEQMVRRLLTSCYDITGEHMGKAEWDDDMQKMVRTTMDEISSAILSGYTQPSHPSLP